MENDLREAIARRVRALLAKTVENGATESEAIAAAEKARQLLDAHRLTQADCEIEAEPIEDTIIDRPNASKIAAVDYCLRGINKYCGTKSWFHTRGGARKIRIIGLTSDVQMAIHLYRMLADTIKSESAIFLRDNRTYTVSPRRMSQSFQVGMAIRVCDRLTEMAAALEPTAKTANGTALVVVKNALVKEAFAKLGLRLSNHGTRGMSIGNGGAYGAGQAAGNRVNLNRPVTGGSQRALR